MVRTPCFLTRLDFFFLFIITINNYSDWTKLTVVEVVEASEGACNCEEVLIFPRNFRHKFHCTFGEFLFFNVFSSTCR